MISSSINQMSFFNQSTKMVDRQCSEICGAYHSYFQLAYQFILFFGSILSWPNFPPPFCTYKVRSNIKRTFVLEGLILIEPHTCIKEYWGRMLGVDREIDWSCQIPSVFMAHMFMKKMHAFFSQLIIFIFLRA